jgi:hypothetical protein
MNQFYKDDKVWFNTGTHSKEIGIITMYWGYGWYIVGALDKNTLYVVYQTDISKF